MKIKMIKMIKMKSQLGKFSPNIGRLLMILAFPLVTQLQAQEYHHMLSTENSLHNGGYFSLSSTKGQDKNDKYFYFGFSYSYSLLPKLFLKFRPKYKNSQYRNGSSSITIGSDLGLVFNFLSSDTKLTEAFYLAASLGGGKMISENINYIGMNSFKSKSTKSYRTVAMEIGKRFQLSSNISYSPSVEYFIYKENSYYQEEDRVLNFLKFDIFI